MTTTGIKKQNSDKGFSLVELIIVVSILAIAAIPLMRSMAMATRVNAKAQSMQNATSLAEHVMEDVKSSDIEAIVNANGGFDASGKCEYTYPLKTATQGEQFDATVTIDISGYMTGDGDITTKSDNVKDANRLKLPVIEDIDTLSQAVLTSQKEFNKYDSAAQSFFNEKKADYDPFNIDPTKKNPANIDSKEITIEKKNVSGGYNGVTVKASVTYKSGGESFVRELYTGSFIAEKKDDGSYKKLDSNIYIFYRKGTIAETIKIIDKSHPDVETATDSHRIYFIRLSSTDTGPIMIDISGDNGDGTCTFTSLGGADNGRLKFTNVEVISNLDSTGRIYNTEERIRVYDVTVTLTKTAGSETTEYAKLTSTATADDAVPDTTE